MIFYILCPCGLLSEIKYLIFIIIIIKISYKYTIKVCTPMVVEL